MRLKHAASSQIFECFISRKMHISSEFTGQENHPKNFDLSAG
jgi:hypothetical protein